VLNRNALKVIGRIRNRLGVDPAGAKLQAFAAEHAPKIREALAERLMQRTGYRSVSHELGYG
jgi:hypothetical protein